MTLSIHSILSPQPGEREQPRENRAQGLSAVRSTSQSGDRIVIGLPSHNWRSNYWWPDYTICLTDHRSNRSLIWPPFVPHLNRVQNAGNFRCKICGKSYQSRHHLIIHERRHSVTSLKNYENGSTKIDQQCSNQSPFFSFAQGEKPFSCQICQNQGLNHRFVSKSTVVSHLLKFHGDRPVCIVFDHSFSNFKLTNLLNLLNCKFLQVERFKCPVQACSKIFRGKISYERHLATHFVGSIWSTCRWSQNF